MSLTLIALSNLLVKLIYSFIAGAISVSTLSLTADRFGSKLAGVLGGFPASVAVVLFSLAYARGPIAASEAAGVIPLMMALYGVYLTVFVMSIRLGLARAIGISTLVWIACALPAVAFAHRHSITMLAPLLVLGASYYIVEKRHAMPSRAGRPVQLRFSQFLIRILIGGGLVAGAVLAGAVSSPLLAGVIAAFPAVTAATLVVTYQSGGAELSQAVAKSIMFSALINVPAYAAAVWLFYPLYGVATGTTLAGLVVVVTSILTFLFARWKLA